MREVKSTQRRRRLRLIQAEETRTEQRFQKAASALTIAADTEAARIEAEALQQHLSMECRARSRTRLRVEHPGAAPLAVVMTRPYLLIGSDPACDLTLDHEEIAPRHSFLQWVDGQIYCCDIAPRPGNVPSRRQPANGRWLNQEPIEIGPYQLCLDSDAWLPEPDYSPLDRSSRLLDDFPQFALQFKGVEQSDNEWPVNRLLTMIGRGVQCKLRLNHPSLPIVQACLLRTKNSCWLIDVAGAGTTGVNGRMIRVADIDVGDTLQLGPFQVEVMTTVFDPVDISSRSKKPKATSKPLSTGESNQTSQPPVDTKSPSCSHLEQPSARSPVSVPMEKVQTETVVSATDSQNEGSRLDAMDSFVGLAANATGEDRLLSISVPVTTSVPPTAEILESIPSPIHVRPELIEEFVQSQHWQLALLKTHLNQLKTLHAQASGRRISKRVTSLLDNSVNEALETHKAISQSLAKFVKATECTTAEKD